MAHGSGGRFEEPSPSAVLRALWRYSPRLFAKSPIVRVKAERVWVSATRAARSDGLERRFGVTVAQGLTGFVPRRTLETSLAGEHAWSDYYFSHGTPAMGSGRSVFLDGHQLRGVGRTVQASSVGPVDEIDGRIDLRHTVQELAKGLVIARVLRARPLVPAFALLVPRGTAGAELDSFILGRLGSPLRVAHLQFLAAAHASMRPDVRLALGRRFLNELCGRRGLDVTAARVEGLLDAIVARALDAVVESRFVCVRLTNWADNGDVFARPFDFEDAVFFAPVAIAEGASLPAPERGQSPHAYLASSVRVRASDVAPYLPSLQSLTNALDACRLIADAVGYDAGALSRRYPWPALRAGYVDAVTRWMAAELRARITPAMRQAARGVARELPLAPPVPSTDLRWDAVVDALLRGTAGRPARSEARIAAALQRAAGAEAARALGRRWEKLFTAIDGDRIRTTIAEALRRAKQVEAELDVSARAAGYARTFAELETFARSMPRRA